MSSYLRGYVCHSWVQSATLAPLLFDTHSAKHRKPKLEEANRAFFRYLWEVSPVRNFILNDDFETLMEGGAIIDCQKAGPDVSLWICKAFRLSTEEPWRIDAWHQLVNKGVHPMLALCTVNCMTESYLLSEYTTHCTIFTVPRKPKQIECLFIDHLPDHKTGLKKSERYYDFDTARVFGGSENDYPGYGKKQDPTLLPLSEKGTVVKVPDGWGGFTQKYVGQDLDVLAAELIKLQEEYTKK